MAASGIDVFDLQFGKECSFLISHVVIVAWSRGSSSRWRLSWILNQQMLVDTMTVTVWVAQTCSELHFKSNPGFGIATFLLQSVWGVIALDDSFFNLGTTQHSE